MNSTGEVLLPLDSDDLIDPHYLEHTVPRMMRDPGLGIVATNWDLFGSETRTVEPKAPTLAMELEGNHLPVTSLIRRAAFIQAGGYNTRLDLYEDWNMWIDILKRGWRAVICPEVLFHYRRRSGSMISRAYGRHIELHNQLMAIHQ
jgi:hypothetical protein